MKYPRISPGRAGELIRNGLPLPTADHRIVYPSWYLRRWHFLPDGYLSRRSVLAYDAVIPHLYNAGRERVLHDQVLRVLRAHGTRSLVEFGCGTGRFLARARDLLPGAALTGVDLSPFMLDRAAVRTADRDVVIQHADATRAEPGTFDAGVAMHLFGHIPGDVASAAAANLARAIAPGGWLVLVEHRWHRLPALPGLALHESRRLAMGTIDMLLYRKEAATSGAAAGMADFA